MCHPASKCDKNAVFLESWLTLTLGNRTVVYFDMVTRDNQWWRRPYAVGVHCPLDCHFSGKGNGERKQWTSWAIPWFEMVCLVPNSFFFFQVKNMMTLLTWLPKVDVHDGCNTVGKWPCWRHFNIWLRGLVTRCWWDVTLQSKYQGQHSLTRVRMEPI